jgi:hypothetical protein
MLDLAADNSSMPISKTRDGLSWVFAPYSALEG